MRGKHVCLYYSLNFSELKKNRSLFCRHLHSCRPVYVDLETNPCGCLLILPQHPVGPWGTVRNEDVCALLKLKESENNQESCISKKKETCKDLKDVCPCCPSSSPFPSFLSQIAARIKLSLDRAPANLKGYICQSNGCSFVNISKVMYTYPWKQVLIPCTLFSFQT